MLTKLSVCALVTTLWVCSTIAFAEEGYKPLFSDAVLEQADPEARLRLEALNERNRQRWLEQQSASGTATIRARRDASNNAANSKDAASGGAKVPGRKLYRVTDAQGNVRFSDQYVAGAKEVSVSVAEPSEESRAAHAARQEEQALALEYFDDRNRRREQEAAAQARRDADAADRKQRCHDLFLEIQDNRRGGFVSYDVGPDGERTFLTEAELATRTDAMEVDYRSNCGELPPIGR